MVGFFLWWKKYFKYKKGLGNAYPAWTQFVAPSVF
jgi:hypothetical protein